MSVCLLIHLSFREGKKERRRERRKEREGERNKERETAYYFSSCKSLEIILHISLLQVA